MKLRKYTLDELRAAISGSVSIHQALQKLNVKAEGGNYQIFHKAVRHFALDTSHFTGTSLKGRKLPPRRRQLAEYLVKGSNVLSSRLKRYLLEQSVFEAACSECGGTT